MISFVHSLILTLVKINLYFNNNFFINHKVQDLLLGPSEYHIAGYFRGVLIFIIFVVHPGVTKFSTHETVTCLNLDRHGDKRGLITFTSFHVPCHMTHQGGGAAGCRVKAAVLVAPPHKVFVTF